MVKATNASIVTIGLVFLSFIFSIVGVVTPFVILKPNDDFTPSGSMSVYEMKGEGYTQKVNCTDAENSERKGYCTASQVLSGILLGLNSILFILSFIILSSGFNKTLKSSCINMNIILLVINISLIITLSLYFNKIDSESNSLFPSLFNIEVKAKLGPSLIVLGINVIIIICTIFQFSNLKITTK